ncbi:MAG: alpha-amylase family glycosyl hydrolase [Polyangiaceae bacterium]
MIKRPRRIGECAEGDFLRAELGSRFSIEAEVPLQPSLVIARTDLPGPVGTFVDLPLHRVAGDRYRVELELNQLGVFHFQLHASWDGGSHFEREARPHGKLKVEPRLVNDLRMYTLIPRVSGRFPEWVKELSRIHQLGFNTLHLLPITMMGPSESPYAISDWFRVTQAYAEPASVRSSIEQFEAFTAEAKRLGIGLCMDLVVNHVAREGNIARNHPEWIVPDATEADGLKRAGFWAGKSWVKWDDVVLLNTGHPEPKVRQALWDELTRYALFWSRFSAETGGVVRLDNAHSTHRGFLEQMLSVLNARYPHVAVLAELFDSEQAAERMLWHGGVQMLLGTAWESPYAADTRRYLLYLHRAEPRLHHYLPVLSQDSGSVAEEYGSAAATPARYAVVALLGLGATGVVQGVEHGTDTRVPFIGAPDGFQQLGDGRYAEALRAINHLQASDSIFRVAKNLHFIDGDHPALVAGCRSHPQTQKNEYLVVANFDVGREQTLHFPDSWRGKPLYSLFGGHPDLAAAPDELRLEPAGVRIYRCG